MNADRAGQAVTGPNQMAHSGAGTYARPVAAAIGLGTAQNPYELYRRRRGSEALDLVAANPTSVATMQMLSKLCRRDDGGLSLPEDIILEVLLRLPAKDLRRCRCVCNGWRALISDPAFFAARRSRGRAGPLIVAVFGSAPELELRLLDDVGSVHRVFKVRTPVLLAPMRLDLIFVDRIQLGAMIIDPASGHDFTVVGTAEPPPRYSWESTSTAMNDYSFGRAVPSGDYKVLRLYVIETSSRWDDRSPLCEVCTIMDDGAEPTWRPRPWGRFLQTSFSCEHKTTVNGNLYFFILSDNYWGSHGRNVIATFNLETEQWKAEKIKGPPLGRKEEDKWLIALTELKGTLCLVHNVHHLTDFGGHYANIWLLKDPNGSVWVKEYKIQLPERLLFTKPLDFLTDGTLLLLSMFQKAGNNEKCHRYVLQLYNSSTKAFTNFMDMAEGFNGRMAFYTGSIQS